jgi:hypothetical protein
MVVLKKKANVGISAFLIAFTAVVKVVYAAFILLWHIPPNFFTSLQHYSFVSRTI